MSYNTYSLGLRIYLDAVYTQDTSIGLYTEGGISYLRWSEIDLLRATSLGLVYKPGILADQAFSEIRQSADLRRSGGVAKMESVSVTFANYIAGERMWKALSDLGISLAGLRCQIIEFTIDKQVYNATADEMIMYTGIVETQQWDEGVYELSIVDPVYKRKANILTTIPATATDEAKTIPATFGYLPKAKFIKTLEKETPITNINAYCEPQGISAFPIVAKISSTQYQVSLGSSRTGSGVPIVDFTNKFMRVFEGGGAVTADLTGQIRRITGTTMDASPSTLLTVDVADPYEDDLAGNSTATAENQAWIQFIDFALEYTADAWPCKSLCDDAGAEISDKPDIFIFDKTFQRLPNFGLGIADANKNKLSADPKYFDYNIDKMNSYAIIAVNPSDVALCNEDNLTIWGKPSAIKYQAGIFGDFNPHLSAVSLPSNYDAVADRTILTDGAYHALTSSPEDYGHFYLAIEFKLPTFPTDFVPSKIYVGIRAVISQDSFADSTGDCIEILHRRFLGNATGIIGANNVHSGLVSDMPGFYSLDSTDNAEFYVGEKEYRSLDSRITGYEYFEISGITTIEQYNSIYKCAILCDRYRGILIPNTFEFTLYELCIIFTDEKNIEDAVYSGIKGRIFNSTWDSRKTAANVMLSPIDILEHLIRHFNWSETGQAEPADGWGLAEISFPYLNYLSTAGGFDSTTLNPVRSMQLARQILSYEEGWTDQLCESICKCAWLLSYQLASGANSGFEAVEYLFNSATPTETITLADIPASKRIGRIEEPNATDIYCEPFVNYDYDYGSGTYLKQIAIQHSQAASYSAAYTPGLSSGDGEPLWDACHALAGQFRQVEQAPSDLTDQIWINTDADALLFLTNWIAWMGKKRVSVPLTYLKARYYYVGKRISLTLPHQTNGSAMACMVESVAKNIYENSAEVKLIIIGAL